MHDVTNNDTVRALGQPVAAPLPRRARVYVCVCHAFGACSSLAEACRECSHGFPVRSSVVGTRASRCECPRDHEDFLGTCVHISACAQGTPRPLRTTIWSCERDELRAGDAPRLESVSHCVWVTCTRSFVTTRIESAWRSSARGDTTLHSRATLSRGVQRDAVAAYQSACDANHLRCMYSQRVLAFAIPERTAKAPHPQTGVWIHGGSRWADRPRAHVRARTGILPGIALGSSGPWRAQPTRRSHVRASAVTGSPTSAAEVHGRTCQPSK
jgi:hypothetical protein